MKIVNAIAVAGMVATLAMSGFAATPTAGKAKKSATPTHKMAKMRATTPKKSVQVAKLVCPVTGETIASIKDAQGHSTYKGKTYYFCCPSCKPMFDKNPAKYAK